MTSAAPLVSTEGSYNSAERSFSVNLIFLKFPFSEAPEAKKRVRPGYSDLVESG
jgi:hypothetical protein